MHKIYDKKLVFIYRVVYSRSVSIVAENDPTVKELRRLFGKRINRQILQKCRRNQKIVMTRLGNFDRTFC